MSISLAAARVYAKALFDLADAGGGLRQAAGELNAVRDAIAGLEPELRGFFEMPLVRREDKKRLIGQAFAGKVGRPVLGLLNVLVDKRREQLLDAIVIQFNDLMDQHEGRIQASVTSARPIGPDLAAALQAALEQRLARPVTLTQKVDQSLIGGIKVNVGDRVLDGTLRRALLDMRRTLTAPRS
ncbi:MAG TPA: ATP synthase F1 subunit delta [Actinomycetota bacterium]|nr:ATP synthase F1 subunit delta [Actinomycetota bacterium]